MKQARIEFTLEGDKRIVTYEAEGLLGAVDFPEVPVLLVEVRDAEDAVAVAAAIEKVGRPPARRKKKSRTPTTDPVPPTGNGGGASGGVHATEGTPSSGERVASEEGSHTRAGPRGRGEEAGQDRAGASDGQRGSAEGEPPTPAAAAKASCGGEKCRALPDKSIHDPATCPKFRGQGHAKRILEQIEGGRG